MLCRLRSENPFIGYLTAVISSKENISRLTNPSRRPSSARKLLYELNNSCTPFKIWFSQSLRSRKVLGTLMSSAPHGALFKEAHPSTPNLLQKHLACRLVLLPLTSQHLMFSYLSVIVPCCFSLCPLILKRHRVCGPGAMNFYRLGELSVATTVGVNDSFQWHCFARWCSERD